MCRPPELSPRQDLHAPQQCLQGDLAPSRTYSQRMSESGGIEACPGEASRPTTPRPVRDGLLLGLAVGVSGLAFGAAAVGSGLNVLQNCVLSLLAYTGAFQFALAGTIAAGGSLFAGSAGAILLGSRNTLYSLRLAGLLRVRGAGRLVLAQGVTDESTALARAIGAGSIGSPQSFGLDVIGPAAFLALIWPRLSAGRTERLVGAGGAAIAIATTP